jgi:hypothetical protein
MNRIKARSGAKWGKRMAVPNKTPSMAPEKYVPPSMRLLEPLLASVRQTGGKHFSGLQG